MITPIEFKNGIFFKRDDLYKPFDDSDINGGKLRQCDALIAENLGMIKEQHNSHIVTSCGLSSPQGLIVAKIAEKYGLKCSVFYGNISEKTIQENKLICEIKNTGAHVESIAKIGYDSVLMKRMKDRQVTEKFFIVKFGINGESVLEPISKQVQNIPDKLTNLVIPTGSGITAAAIINGLHRYNKYVENIHVVQISGYDRMKTINELLTEASKKYIYTPDKTYPYSKKVKVWVDDIELDEIYEAKAYNWMLRNLHTENTLFWIVGNANYFR